MVRKVEYSPTPSQRSHRPGTSRIIIGSYLIFKNLGLSVFSTYGIFEASVKLRFMRTIFAIIFVSTFSLIAYSQDNQTSEKRKSDNEFGLNGAAYRLFPTTNMWTFIKLNTRNGQMWQVQYDVQGTNLHENYLSVKSLVSIESETNDRFALYPTQNIYNFILVDQLDGRVWQVQWSQESETRVVIPIR